MEKVATSADLDQQVVIFRLADSSYAVEISAVREIIRPQPVTVVPQAPPFVVGVINLRSSIVPVLDLRRRCGLPAADQTRDSRVVVVQVEEQSVGLQVDSVSEVISLPLDCVEPAAGLIRGAAQEQLLRGVARLDERLVMLLDLSHAIDTTSQMDLTGVEALAATA
jgi:purine-binding chemotaxis protein CheW